MRLSALASMILWICLCWGCAALGPSDVPQQWRCQPEADAAVSHGDWESALTLHRELVRRQADNCLAIYHLGYIWGKMGDRSKEVALYQRALACGYDQDDRLLFNLGMAYAELGRTEEAIGTFKRAVALKPSRADNHYGLGLMLMETGLPDKAMEAFSAALDADAGYWEARTALVQILLDQGRLETARVHLEVLSQSMPDDEQVRRLWRIYQQRRITLYD